MIKILIGVLISISLIADSYLLVSGIAIHGKSDNKNHEGYEFIIPGVGYQYKYNKYVSNSVIIVRDSNKNFMPIVSAGITYPIHKYLNLGIDTGIAYRKIQKVNIDEYRIIPVGMLKAEIPIDKYFLNINYVPEAYYKDYHIVELLYITIGVNF